MQSSVAQPCCHEMSILFAEHQALSGSGSLCLQLRHFGRFAGS